MTLTGPVADALRRGAAIVAASPRAARALHFRHAEDQRAQGRSVWSSPPITDWDSWLRELWREHAFANPSAPMLLSTLQERALWTRVQRDDAALVLSPEQMAALAMEAWSLLSAWNAHAARRLAWEHTDAEGFRHWAQEFERECTRHRWLSASQLEPTLTAVLGFGTALTLPPELCLVGFAPTRITPAQRAFLTALEARGVRLTNDYAEPSFTQEESRRQWVAAPSSREEIAACAAWAREILSAHPHTCIGILAVSAARGEIERTFRRVLMPASEDIRQPSAPMPFEFSLGHPLAEVPAVRAALLLLRWTSAPLPARAISWLVLSGFVADTATVPIALARHDAGQRSTGSITPERSLDSYRDSLAADPALRTLRNTLGTLLRAVEANRVREEDRQPSAWAELVHLLLDRAGWPGERPDDSVQFQALQRWQRLLDDLALLDFDGARISWPGFLALLERHASETIFAPESHDAPIQIMGPLESSGQQFDSVWFLGTDDLSWPMRGRLHALLPPSVQRDFRMPHATPEDDWNLAHAVTTRLLAGTPNIVFSYAQRNEDAELRPSPLVAGLFPQGAYPIAAASLHPAPLQSIEPPPGHPLESIADDSGVLPWPIDRTAGGSEVLKRQATCAFQSFATRRLAARPIEESERGLSPAEKGKILHEVLQRLFSEPEPAPLRTRDDLVTAIATNRLAGILDAHIEAVFHASRGPEGPGAGPSTPWRDAYLAAERRPLRIRLTDWLTIEAGRQPFTVEACEQRLPDVHIGDLRLNLRADRIDRLVDGTRLLIDYKTGVISPAAWRGERLAEPQLPLYAAYGNVENLSGILFAQIRAGETKFEGRIRDAQAQLLADAGARSALVTDPYSDRMCEDWARALARLAEDFLRGEAAVNPRDPKVCTLCRLQGLCRVAENSFAFATANGDEEEEPADA